MDWEETYTNRHGDYFSEAGIQADKQVCMCVCACACALVYKNI